MKAYSIHATANYILKSRTTEKNADYVTRNNSATSTDAYRYLFGKPMCCKCKEEDKPLYEHGGKQYCFDCYVNKTKY